MITRNPEEVYPVQVKLGEIFCSDTKWMKGSKIRICTAGKVRTELRARPRSRQDSAVVIVSQVGSQSYGREES